MNRRRSRSFTSLAARRRHAKGAGRRSFRPAFVESLEPREMLAWDFFFANGGLLVQTPDAGEVGALRVDAVTQDVLIDVDGSGVFQQTGARLTTLSAPIQILVNVPPNSTAIIDDTTFTIDNASGAFLANKQFLYNGGPGINNSLTITGGAEDDIFTLAPPVGEAGALQIEYSIGTSITRFTGSYSNLTGALTLEGRVGLDVLGVQGTAAVDSFLIDATKVQQFSTAPNFVPGHVINYAGFESFDVQGGDEADVIMLANLPGQSTVNGGEADDSISVTLALGGDIDVDGGAGNDTLRVLGTTGNDRMFVDFQSVGGIGAGVVRFSAATIETLHVSGEAGNDDLTLQMPRAFPPPFVGDVLPATVVLFGDGQFANGNDAVKIFGTDRTPNSLGDDTIEVGDIDDGAIQVVEVEALLVNGLSGDDIITNNSLTTNSVLIGGDDDDTITAVDAKDILIGGDGLDTFDSGADDDYLFTDQDELGFVFINDAEPLDAGDDRDTGVFGNIVAQVFGDIQDVDTANGFDDVANERVAFTIDPLNPTSYLYQATPALVFLEEALRTPTAVRLLGQPGNLRGAFATYDAFVARSYTRYLDRAVDQAGLRFWSDQGDQGTPIDVVQAAIASTFEYVQNRTALSSVQWVRAFINDSFGRRATDAELNRLSLRLDTGEAKFNIALELLRTPEARDAQIEEVYDNIIGSGPSSRDRDAIRADMSTGLTILDIARLVVQSNGAYLNYVIAHNNTSVGYIGGLYRDVLKRGSNFTLGEITAWVNLMVVNRLSRDAVAQAFLGSTEYRAQVIDGYYRTYLGRAADGGGLNFWVGAMSRGVRDEDVLSGIVASNEFFQKNGATSERYVRAMYARVLQRSIPPSQGEIDYWVSQLAISTRTAVQARAEVALTFQFSDEFRAIVVNLTYQRYLNRAPNSVELENALDALRVGFTQEALAQQIIVSRGVI